MNFSLYEIDTMLQEAIDAIHTEAEANEGVYGEEWDTILDSLQMDRQKKLLDCARYVKTMEAMAEATKAEKMALAARQAAYEGKADRIKQYVAQSMMQGNDGIVQDANTRLSWRRSESVEIMDEKQLPSQFVEVKYVPIKADIKTALKAGKDIPGARIIEKQSLQIK